jgi:hypothetical protein
LSCTPDLFIVTKDLPRNVSTHDFTCCPPGPGAKTSKSKNCPELGAIAGKWEWPIKDAYWETTYMTTNQRKKNRRGREAPVCGHCQPPNFHDGTEVD